MPSEWQRGVAAGWKGAMEQQATAPENFDADTYLGRVGEETDIWLNVACLNGKPGVTVSLHAAEAKKAGERWGCILCRCLSLIQANHCALTLDPNAVEAKGAAIRFGLVMLSGFVLFGWLISLIF